MEKLTVSLLVGNGLNHFISNYYKDNQIAVLQKIKKYLKRNPEDAQVAYDTVCEMLEGYKSLLNFISLEAYDNKGEDLIARLNELFDDLDENMMDDFVNKVKIKVQERMELPLRDSEIKNRSICKMLARTFYYHDTTHPIMYALESQLPDYEIDLSVFTTNYDGIAEQIFNPFIRNSTCAYQAHALHGNYTDTQIICHNPAKKFEAISNDSTLSERFTIFQNKIPKTDILIIFGNSLGSDLHILDVLNAHSFKKVIIIDAQPYKYINQYSEEPFIYKASQLFGISTWKSDTAPADYQIVSTPEQLMESLRFILDEGSAQI